MTLSSNKQIAEDLTEETFYKAFKNISSFKGTCKMSVWLCQIAKNTYFYHYNRQKKVQYFEDTPDSNFNLDSRNLAEEMVQKELKFRIHSILHTLDEPYKELFTLRVFGELEYREICSLFQKSESWARVTFYRAKGMIQKKLLEDELK